MRNARWLCVQIQMNVPSLAARKGDQMSDTPRTDEASLKEISFAYEYRGLRNTEVVDADFARQLERELAQAKEQLAAREARISEILSNLHQYKDDPFIEAAVRFTQDDLLILREHEAKVLEEAAEITQALTRTGNAGEIEETLRRLAVERRRNHGT